MQILIEVDESMRPALAWEREEYNTALSPTTLDGETEVPNPALIATDEAYLTLIVGQRVQRANERMQLVQPVAPTPGPEIVNGIPQSCTRKQGLKALARANTLGFPAPITEADILAFIDAMPETTDAERLFKIDARIEFTTAPTWQRTSPFVMALAAGLGLPEAAVDALFVLANTFVG